MTTTAAASLSEIDMLDPDSSPASDDEEEPACQHSTSASVSSEEFDDPIAPPTPPKPKKTRLPPIHIPNPQAAAKNKATAPAAKKKGIEKRSTKTKAKNVLKTKKIDDSETEEPMKSGSSICALIQQLRSPDDV
jgi:hypothetical protein